MPFCSKCGASLTDDAQFCPNCGANQAAAPTAAPQPAYGSPEQADISRNKGISVLSYLGVLVFIPMLTRKESPFAQFHVRQGFTLFCANVILAILSTISNFITTTRVEYIWGVPVEYEARPVILTVLISLCSLFIAVMAIIGIVNCCRGEKKKLPLIGDLDVLKMFGQ